MTDLVQHLSEQHQFYIAMLDKAVSIMTIIYLGMSQPPKLGSRAPTVPPLV